MNLFEVVVRILISQLLRGLPLELTMLKPVFDGKFSKSHVLGVIFCYFWILGVLMLNLAFLTPKRHFLIRKDIYRCISWNSPISGVGCTLVSRTPKRWKMPSRMYMLGICRKVTPYANVMKLGTVGPVGYVIALTAVGPHRLTGFGVSRHPSWVPAIDKAHRAYYIAVLATAGTHDHGYNNY